MRGAPLPRYYSPVLTRRTSYQTHMPTDNTDPEDDELPMEFDDSDRDDATESAPTPISKTSSKPNKTLR